jgi:hypothetical protein
MVCGCAISRDIRPSRSKGERSRGCKRDRFLHRDLLLHLRSSEVEDWGKTCFVVLQLSILTS